MARVLVLEDEPLIAMMMEDWLRELGHEPIGPAGSVAEALVLVEVDPTGCSPPRCSRCGRHVVWGGRAPSGRQRAFCVRYRPRARAGFRGIRECAFACEALRFRGFFRPADRAAGCRNCPAADDPLSCCTSHTLSATNPLPGGIGGNAVWCKIAHVVFDNDRDRAWGALTHPRLGQGVCFAP